MKLARIALALLPLVAACKRESAPTKPTETPSSATKLPTIPRGDFNRIAQELDLPIFWAEDKNGNGVVDPDELAMVWGLSAGRDASRWLGQGALTKAAGEAIAQIASIRDGAHPTASDPKEKKRRAAVLKELAQGRATLIAHDFSAGSKEDRAIAEHVSKAAELIEQIHLRQRGAAMFLDELAKVEDPASHTLFYRNQGPWCVAPATESDPDCNALPSLPPQLSGLYPASVQKEGFCEALSAAPATKAAMLDHFSVVEERDGKLVAVPYPEAYAEQMNAISAELKAAAAAIESPEEAAFKAYLEAAAASFVSNDWKPADEAWSKMNVQNSKWYLRIGPDEVYFEPCSQKAGFHVSFGLIDKGSLEWQQKLEPIKQEMELVLSKFAGPPYKQREVDFHLPDFIEVVLNAGDSRSPHGATIGQSLPNWGPVANEGRGRTVAMTNFYTDPDSKSDYEAQARSLFCAGSMARFTTDPAPQIMSTVLHEAAHNLGPAHEYKVKGKVDDEVFGGPMASTLEELKSQTAALMFTDWLVTKGVIEKDYAETAHMKDLIWSFGHISRGMYTAEGKPKPYSQLAAIQVRWFIHEGALEWKAEEKAANGADQGCFEIHHDKLPNAIESLMLRVARIKSRGDKVDAEALRAELVDKDDESKKLMEVVQERVLRAPKASFLYGIRF